MEKYKIWAMGGLTNNIKEKLIAEVYDFYYAKKFVDETVDVVHGRNQLFIFNEQDEVIYPLL